jgi:hypothetical protein
LHEVSNKTNPDVTVHLGNSPFSDGAIPDGQELLVYESSYRNEAGDPVLRMWQIPPGGHRHLVYCDGTEFWLNSTGESIWACWPETLSLENTLSYLLGPVLGLLLRVRGIVCLHASAVNLQDSCIAFAGAEGAGKSTIAAAFVQRGHAAISDDIVALDERKTGYRIVPAYPHLSLWPDSMKALYGPGASLPCFAPNWEKRRLALASDEKQFENRPLPLAAIYLLRDRSAEPAPFVETVSDQEALLALVVNSYATNILDGKMRAQEFESLGRLVLTVPVRQITPHQDPALIGKLYQVIRNDFETLTSLRPRAGKSLSLSYPSDKIL